MQHHHGEDPVLYHENHRESFRTNSFSSLADVVRCSPILFATQRLMKDRRSVAIRACSLLKDFWALLKLFMLRSSLILLAFIWGALLVAFHKY